MAQMPRKEGDIVILAESIIAGLTAHPDDFPSITPAGLQSMLDDYKQQRDAQLDAQSQTITATEGKDTALEVLTTSMKDLLKRAEADTTPDPSKLYEIGWGPRNQPQPLTPPSFPGNLHPIAEGNGMLWLSWEKPAAGAGGDVWNYIVERRQQGEGQQFSEWTYAGQSYNCEVNLTEQPTDVRLEYRVKASNTAGQSTPSNSVSVVLP